MTNSPKQYEPFFRIHHRQWLLQSAFVLLKAVATCNVYLWLFTQPGNGSLTAILLDLYEKCPSPPCLGLWLAATGTRLVVFPPE